jgi:hypothetical protein
MINKMDISSLCTADETHPIRIINHCRLQLARERHHHQLNYEEDKQQQDKRGQTTTRRSRTYRWENPWDL